MNIRWRILLLGLPFLLLGVGVDAAAQVGRLMGNVAYYGRDRRVYAARGARVVAVGNYVQSETRADAYGNFALMLRPGGYRVYAQGAYGYSPGQATGYVRAGANSYISPNPVLLVQQAAGEWDGMTSLAPGQTSSLSEGGTSPSANSLTPVVMTQDAPGRLYGRVLIRYDNGRVEPARNRRVIIRGAYRNTESQTGPQGYFMSSLLRPGAYAIYVVAEGFQQDGAVGGTVRSRAETPVSPNPILLVPLRRNPPPRPGREQ